jgi:aspartate-semialdehyde dehydrogenase
MARPDLRPTRRPAHIALFEANSLLGKGLKEHLVARRFPAASVRLFTSSDDEDANLGEYGGEAMLVTRPDPDTLGRLDIAFLCGSEQEGEPYLEWPGRSGFAAIDLSAAAFARGAPSINVDVNPEAIPSGAGLIAAPGPIAHLMSSLLAPIRRGPGLLGVLAVVFQPASAGGGTGIDELYRQSAALLNFQEAPRAVFGDQLAFNLIPAFLYPDGKPPGGARAGRLEAEVAGITGSDHPLSVQVVLAPVFHGHAVFLAVRLPEGRTEGELRAALAAAPGVALAGAGDRATPLGRAGRDGILIDGIRPAGGSWHWVWAVADNLAGGAALNAVRIAEILVERGLRQGAT